MQTANEDSPRYEGWRVAAASGVGVFFSTLFFYTFAVFLKPLCGEFGWSRQAVSTAYGAMALTAAVSAPVLGHLLDRLGSRRVILACAALSAVAFASLSALTAQLSHLYAVFAVLGVAAAGTSALAYSRVIPSWFERRRGLAIGVVMAAAALGGILQPPAAQELIRAVGWRGAYLALGGLLLAVALPVIVRFVRERPSSSGSGPATADPGLPARDGFRSRTFWTLVVVFFGGTLVSNGAIVHLAALLTDRGVAASHAAIAVSAMGGASLAGRLLTGVLIDRFAATRVSFLLLATAALGAFVLAGARSPGVGIAAAVLVGFGAGGEADVTPYLLSRYFGLRAVSTLFGVVWTAAGCAGVVGPLLMARAFDATGSYETVLLRLAAVTLAAGVLMLILPACTPPRD
jgi:MFS family permease